MKRTSKLVVTGMLTAVFGFSAVTEATAAERNINQARNYTSKREKTSADGNARKGRTYPAPKKGVSMAAIESVLSKKGDDNVTSVAALDKELAWAKNFEKTYLSGAANTGFDRYKSLSDKFSDYVMNLRKYSMSTMDMCAGMDVCIEFNKAVLYCHINKILPLLPSEASRSAFKSLIVDILNCADKYQPMVTNVYVINFGYPGSIYALTIGSRCGSLIQSIDNNLLGNVWNALTHKVVQKASDPQKSLAALTSLMVYKVNEFDMVERSTFEDEKKQFLTSANNVLNAYKNWLGTVPSLSDTLANSISSLFVEMKNQIDEELSEME